MSTFIMWRYFNIDISSILPKISKYCPPIWVLRYISATPSALQLHFYYIAERLIFAGLHDLTLHHKSCNLLGQRDIKGVFLLILGLFVKLWKNKRVWGPLHSPNLPYSDGIGSLAAAIPVLKVV